MEKTLNLLRYCIVFSLNRRYRKFNTFPRVLNSIFTYNLPQINNIVLISRKYSNGEKCWNCQYMVKKLDLFCSKCNYIQVPNTDINYFELMDVTQNFEIDLPKLTKTYRDLQRHLHPDKFTTKSSREQELSEQQSSLVNRAYKVLSNRMERGLYLLELYKNPLLEDTKNLEPEFLMKIMELNEHLAEIKEAKNLEEFRHSIYSSIEEMYVGVSDAFKHSDIEKAHMLLTKLKYYESLIQQIQKLKDEFLD